MKKYVPQLPTLLLVALIGISFGSIGERRGLTPNFGRAQAGGSGIDAKFVDLDASVVKEISIADAVFVDRDEDVQLTVFTDYECPYCKRFHEEVLPEIKANIQIRNLPLPMHANAVSRARFVECSRIVSGNGAGIQAADRVFAAAGQGQPELDYLTVATEMTSETEGEVIAECVSGLGRAAKAVDLVLARDAEAVTALGLGGTPTILIGDKGQYSGAYPAADVNKKIEELYGK